MCKKNQKSNRTWAVKGIVISAVMGICLTGCQFVNQESSGEALVTFEQPETTDTTVLEPETSTTTISEPEEPALYPGTYRSSSLVEDDDCFYFCSPFRIIRIHKETNEMDTLWENERAYFLKASAYGDGNAILLENKIYFLEKWEEKPGTEQRGLSVIGTDGSGYKRLYELEGYGYNNILLQDGMLYLDDVDKEVWIPFYADGTIGEAEYYDADNKEQISYKNNGYKVRFAKENTRDEVNVLTDFEDYSDLIAIEPEGIYVTVNHYTETQDTKIFKETTVERVAMETGERTVLFTIEPPEDTAALTLKVMDYVVQDGYFYSIEENDYQFYLVRRDLSHPEKMEILGDSLYDTGIGAIGYKDAYQEKSQGFWMLDACSEWVECRISMSWPVVDAKYPGATVINTKLKEHRDAILGWVESMVQESEEPYPEVDIYSSYSSLFSGYEYFDSRYISFYLADYEHLSGAAHGMPDRLPYTFDLETGEELRLPDIIENSEAEVNELVTSYFAEKINADPEAYWEGAIDVVREQASLDSDFYLTERGICFYYHPYDLAAYGAGFPEVVIPYEEFEMKIVLEKAGN